MCFQCRIELLFLQLMYQFLPANPLLIEKAGKLIIKDSLYSLQRFIISVCQEQSGMRCWRRRKRVAVIQLKPISLGISMK